jgi:hypothetical protein
MYSIIVTHYGNILAMQNVSGLPAAFFMTFFCLDGVVQAFFTYRVYVLSGHWWFAAPLWTCELISFGVHTSMVVFATRSNETLDFIKNHNGLWYAAMFLSVIVRLPLHT